MWTDLHISHKAVCSVDQSSYFEFLESDAQYPVSRRATERSEPIPACHRLPYILWRHFGTRDIFIDINSLVTVVPLHFSCETNKNHNNVSRRILSAVVLRTTENHKEAMYLSAERKLYIALLNDSGRGRDFCIFKLATNLTHTLMQF